MRNKTTINIKVEKTKEEIKKLMQSFLSDNDFQEKEGKNGSYYEGLINGFPCFLEYIINNDIFSLYVYTNSYENPKPMTGLGHYFKKKKCQEVLNGLCYAISGPTGIHAYYSDGVLFEGNLFSH